MLSKLLRDQTFTVVDTETTGLSPIHDELVEIAAIQVKPDLHVDVKNSYSTLINPQCKISYSAYRVHGITDEMVKDKPLISTVIKDFEEFSRNTIIVAHNARFDMGFIKNAYKRNNINTSPIIVLDTIKISKKVYPSLRRYNLDTMIETLDLHTKIEALPLRTEITGLNRHRALFDAIYTAMLLVHCIEELERMDIEYTNDLYACNCLYFHHIINS